MDNRVFNVNGTGLDGLKQAIALAFEQDQGFYSSLEPATAEGWIESEEKGLILMRWAEAGAKGFQRFIVPHDPETAAAVVWQWLGNDKVWDKIKLEGWDVYYDGDGSSSKGWRVYCEEWGHVGDYFAAICAIKPAWMWHGK